ncbi:MAG: hypothetical protein Phog2KO_09990 [Phototrophicaceae bacterium]
MIMSVLIISFAVVIAVMLFFFLAINFGNDTTLSDASKNIDWSAINDSELQSYLPNKKINAIKRYRELTGTDLRDAKSAIEYVIAHPDAKKRKYGLSANTEGAGVKDLVLEGRIEEAVEVYSAFMGVDEFTARDAVADLERELSAEANLTDGVDVSTLHDLLAEGKKIEAIKHYKEQTGADLREAKRAIEDME